MTEPITLPVGPIGANCYLVPDGAGLCAVVDPGDEFLRIDDALQDGGLTPCAILLTHGHFDHIGAARALHEKYGCPIVVGQNDAELLENPARSLAGTDGNGRYRFSADRTVRENDLIGAGGLSFRVIDTPGHTKGGVCYLCENMLFSGDTLFRGDCGRTDLYGGDWLTLRRSLQKLSALPDETRVFPGHGPATDMAAEHAGNPALTQPDDDDLY